MAILINGASPESLGITSANISEASLNSSVATLSVDAETYDADTALAHDAPVTIAVDGTQVFKGKVRRRPRTSSPDKEGWSYIVKDAWDELERLPFQVSKDYKDALDATVPSLIGEVTWEADVALGQRITDVINYAISAGVGIAMGTIDTGLPWYRVTYKDRMCAEVLREMMRIMPDHELWLDTRVATPTMHMRQRSNLTAVSYDVTAGNVIVTSEIEAMEDAVVSQVVLRYEKPIQIGDASDTQIFQDVAPPGADGKAVDAMVESIPLSGLFAQVEYAPVTVRDIPQASDTDDDKIDWWIDHEPPLAALAAKFGKANVAMKLTVSGADVPAEDVFAHHLKMVDDGITRPAPINPNATPVTQTLDVSDYPRELVEGALPEWTRKRYRMVAARCTLAIAGSTVASAGDLEKALLGIFTTRKTFGATEYLTSNATGTVMGTNAVKKNYQRTVSFDGGETPPTGIAAALLAELSQVRHTGSLLISGQEIDTAPRIGTALDLENGRPEWEDMGEIIQSLNHDLDNGETSIVFGPPQQLGATDMVERLRACRRNSHATPTPANSNDGVGGTAATPNSNFSMTGAAPAETNSRPWALSLAGNSTDGWTWAVKQNGGTILSGTNGTPLTVTTFDSPEAISADKCIVAESTLTAGEPGSFTISAVDEADSKEVGFDSATPPVQDKLRLRIGKVTFDGSAAKSTQFADSSQIVTSGFLNGKITKELASHPSA